MIVDEGCPRIPNTHSSITHQEKNNSVSRSDVSQSSSKVFNLRSLNKSPAMVYGASNPQFHIDMRLKKQMNVHKSLPSPLIPSGRASSLASHYSPEKSNIQLATDPVNLPHNFSNYN